MTFDKDLQFGRRIFSALAGVNVAAGLLHVWQRNWAFAVTTVIWAFSCLLVRASFKWHQQTRDEVRIARAGNHALLKRMEREP